MKSIYIVLFITVQLLKCWYSLYLWVLINISQYVISLLKVSSGQKADKINAKWAAVVVNFTWLMATQRKTARRRHKGYVPHANLQLRKLPPHNSSCVLPNLYRRWKWQIIWAFTPHGDTKMFLCPALNNTAPSATKPRPQRRGCIPRAPHPSPDPDDGFGVTLAIQPQTPPALPEHSGPVGN